MLGFLDQVVLRNITLLSLSRYLNILENGFFGISENLCNLKTDNRVILSRFI